MAQTFRSRQLRIERAADERFIREMVELARIISALLLTYAVIRDGRRIIPNRRALRDAISAAVWVRILKPYFIGVGDLPFNGPNPLSPFARLIYEGVRGGIEITAEQQAALIRRMTGGADDVYNYLTGIRPLAIAPVSPSPRGFYDPFHRWVDPNGYLSGKTWYDDRWNMY
jgi:hypothetical protein